jgi:hypothetical protein
MMGPTQWLIQIFFIEGTIEEFPMNLLDFGLRPLATKNRLM